MNLSFFQAAGPVLASLPVTLLLPGAAFTDMRERRIPNLLLLLAAFPGGFLLGPAFPGRLLLTALLFLPFFFLRLMGAGDVKLLAVLCAYLGAELFLRVLLLSLLPASVLSLLCLLRGQRSFRLPLAPFLLCGYAASHI